MCDAKTNPKIQHATEKFEPFPTKVFDKWLCQNYWNSLNWEPPIEGDQLAYASLCKSYCAHKSHGNEKSYCTKPALHSDKCKLVCKHDDGCLSNVLDIVFCCDSTGSMGSYIEKSKETCKKIIRDVQ
jgi:hypothetical protein